jgi:hypothetical protein
MLENNSQVEGSCKVLSLYILALTVVLKLWIVVPEPEVPIPVIKTYITLNTQHPYISIQANTSSLLRNKTLTFKSINMG